MKLENITMVLPRGLEPPWELSQRVLSPSRLPIPSQEHIGGDCLCAFINNNIHDYYYTTPPLLSVCT